MLQLIQQASQCIPTFSWLQTPEQQQHLDTLRYLIARPLEGAQNAALLTALTASYRDLYVVMDQFHKKDILGIPRPLLDEPPAASASTDGDRWQQQQQQQQQSGLAQQALQQQEHLTQQQQQQQLNHTQMFYPLRDLTKLPDEPPKEGGFYRNHLQEKYMTRWGGPQQLDTDHTQTLQCAVFLHYVAQLSGLSRYLPCAVAVVEL